MGVRQFRVDSRMLHGQTVTAYGRIMRIDEYVVVNDAVSQDSLQVSLLELAALSSKVHVFSPEDAKDFINNEKFKGKNTMVVFKEIEDAVEYADIGGEIKELQIGSMFETPGRDRKKYDRTLFVDDIDREAFRKLEDHGIELTYQLVPDYQAKKLKDLVDY